MKKIHFQIPKISQSGARFTVYHRNGTALLVRDHNANGDTITIVEQPHINTGKLRKSGQYQKILESEAREGRDFQYFLVLATFEEFGCCKPHSISYLMPGLKTYYTLSPNSVIFLLQE